MRKLLKFFGIIALLIALGIPAAAKKLDLLKFDKGETPNDTNACETSLAEEHPAKKGGVSLKVSISGDDWWIGECPPKRGLLDGFDIIKFGIFNPSKEPRGLNFVIKPKSPISYEDRFDSSIVVRPGQNDLEIEITGACTNGGKPLSLKDRIAIWSLSGGFKKGENFFFQTFKAETADEGDKEAAVKDSGKKSK